MKVPPYLKPGDQVALVSPARSMGRAELEPAVKLIAQNGFVPVLGKHLPETAQTFFLPDEQRIADMQAALDDKDIKAIIAVRGGYGSLRIIDHLDWSGFVQYPKWLVGFSDITVLHNHINWCTNVCSLHATMPVNFLKSEQATQTLFNALKGQQLKYRFSAVEGKNIKPVTGKLVGGNLSLLYALQGSVTDPDPGGCILFLEDLDEYLYQVDRMLLSLKRSGKLARLKALVIGGFTDMKDNAIPFGKTAHEIVLDHVKEYNYPVFFNFPAGHQDLNCAFKLGMECSLIPQGDEIIFTQ